VGNPITGAITVVLADDHQILRQGLGRLLAAEVDIEVVAEAGTGFEALEALRRYQVDVLVLDLSMPDMPGMDLIKRMRSEFPAVKVLVLTMHTEDQYAVRAFRSGASGFITKDSAAGQLVEAIRKLAKGGAYVPSALAERMALGMKDFQDTPLHQQLSNREFEVYRHIVAGKRLTDIADELHLSIKTISTHKARIMEKLGVAGTASLVRYGLQHQLFEDYARESAWMVDLPDEPGADRRPAGVN
jgi:DNA-binding NarL/FixJ family response regulator